MHGAISPRFEALVARLEQRPDGADDLAEGAFVLAAEARPEIDLAAARARLTELIERARETIDRDRPTSHVVADLNRFLFEREAFEGNRDQYDDPRNSYLDEVLTRRRGLPITLSVLYVEVARRLDLRAHGVCFPGHFLAKIVDVEDAPDGEILVDPFFGRMISRADCSERLRVTMGEGVELDASWLRPATAREIYVRMLNNLKLHFLRRGDGIAALGCFDRILCLTPDAPTELRDRGLLLERLECVLPAIDDLTRFLELAPRDESAPAIRRRRDALLQRRPALN